MKVWITKQPHGAVDGLNLDNYRAGQTYDVDAKLANYLVTSGFAVFEMRRQQRSTRTRTNDRRKRH